MQEDLTNYLQWKMMNRPKILKDKVVPHLLIKGASTLMDTNEDPNIDNVIQDTDSKNTDVSQNTCTQSGYDVKPTKYTQEKYRQVEYEVNHKYTQVIPYTQEKGIQIEYEVEHKYTQAKPLMYIIKTRKLCQPKKLFRLFKLLILELFVIY